MHSQQPPGVVQNRSTLQCSKQNTEQCGYDHAPVTRGRMRAQFPLPHGPPHPRTATNDAREGPSDPVANAPSVPAAWQGEQSPLARPSWLPCRLRRGACKGGHGRLNSTRPTSLPLDLCTYFSGR